MIQNQSGHLWLTILGSLRTRVQKKDEEKDFMAKVPYASAIGSLMYVMVCTRLEIAHAVGSVTRFMTNPSKRHWEAVK